jgi:flagellar biogenesis protein FliO
MRASGTAGRVSGEKMCAVPEGSRIFDSSSLLWRFTNSVLTVLRSIKFQRRERLMRLCETLPLGEKRFLAIVQIERQRFLISATNQSVSLLRSLDSSQQSQGADQMMAGGRGNR